MGYIVEKDWVTSAGLRAVVTICIREYQGITYKSHRCGYVGVPKESNFYGSNYNNMDISCHWGLTFSSEHPERNYPVESNLHWFGFDCHHYEDAVIEQATYEIKYGNEGIVRDLDYCITQCESIAKQIMEQESTHSGD